MASTLDFKPDQSLMDFASKLSKRVQESPKAPTVPVAPVQVTNNTALPSPSRTTPESSARQQSTFSPLTCTYCGKPGHKVFHCFQRKKQAAKDAAKRRASPPAVSKPSTAPSQPSSQHTVVQSHSTRDHGVSPAMMSFLAPPQTVPKYCHIHGCSNHVTDECFAIQRLKRNQVTTVGSHKPSGEASRQASAHPT